VKIALVTESPARPSGIADYTRALLEHLRELVEVEVFVAPGDAGGNRDGFTLHAADELRPKRFDRILYQLGNVGAHAFMVPMIGTLGGAVVLHDWILFDLAAARWPALERGGLAGHLVALREGGLAALRIYARNRKTSGRALSEDRFALPFNRSVVRRADAFLVHSEWMRERILEERNAATPIGVVPHGAERLWRDGDRRAARARLELPAGWHDAFLLASFGKVQEHKRIETLLRALALARVERPRLRLVLVGALSCERLDFHGLVRELALEDAVHTTGFLPDERAESYLHAADLCLNLRGPSTGGTSGGLLRAMAVGRAVIASGLAEQRELPDDCVRKIAPDAEEIPALARLLVELHDDDAQRASLEAAARKYVDQQSHWTHVAHRYAEILEAFPAHRSNRKSLIRTAVEAAERRRELVP
jgi:glycosyltransferase involved in cell wall biosynthesis